MYVLFSHSLFTQHISAYAIENILVSEESLLFALTILKSTISIWIFASISYSPDISFCQYIGLTCKFTGGLFILELNEGKTLDLPLLAKDKNMPIMPMLFCKFKLWKLVRTVSILIQGNTAACNGTTFCEVLQKIWGKSNRTSWKNCSMTPMTSTSKSREIKWMRFVGAPSQPYP